MSENRSSFLTTLPLSGVHDRRRIGVSVGEGGGGEARAHFYPFEFALRISPSPNFVPGVLQVLPLKSGTGDVVQLYLKKCNINVMFECNYLIKRNKKMTILYIAQLFDPGPKVLVLQAKTIVSKAKRTNNLFSVNTFWLARNLLSKHFLVCMIDTNLPL